MFKDLILPGPRLYRQSGRHVIDLFIKTVSNFAQLSFHQICRTMLGPSEHVCDIVEGIESCMSKTWFIPFGRHPETTIPLFSKMPGRVQAVGTLYSTFVLTFARAIAERANVETV